MNVITRNLLTRGLCPYTMPKLSPAKALILFCVLLCITSQAVAPSVSIVYPRGGQRNTDLEVIFSGGNLADAVDVMFHTPGISLVSLTAAEAGKVTATLHIDENCALGIHGMRIRTKTGVSNLELFSVGNLPERKEVEPNSLPAEAEAIEANLTLNGTVTSEDVDYYAINLTVGQRIAVEVEGLRLGPSLFDPKLRLFGPAGHEHVAEDDTQLMKQDAAFVYTATEEGRHLVAISEASYGGSNSAHYRLHIGNFPRPLSVTPLGGAPGSELAVKWLGDAGLTDQIIKVPADQEGTVGVEAKLDTGSAPTNQPFRVSTLPGVLEVEPNNAIAEATPCQSPGAFDGVISDVGDMDFFSFTGTNGQVFDFRVWARELGSPLDSVLNLFGPDGKSVAGDDDAAGKDSKFRYTLPADGTYTLRVRDHLDNGGAAYAYRIEATPVVPKLAMKILENRPASLTVPQNNQTYLLINAGREDFGGPIQVALNDLPEHISTTDVVIPDGQGTYPMLITAAPEAPVAGALVDVFGTLQKEDAQVSGGFTQNIRIIQGNNDTTFYGYDIDRLALAVSEPAPFKVKLLPPKAPIVQNSPRNITVEVERAEGFADAIDLYFPWLPTGLGGGTAKIPGDQNSVQIRLEVRDIAPGTHDIFVGARAVGYELCTPYTPIEVQPQWVTFQPTNVETEQGKPVEMKVAITQVQPFEGTFDLQLRNLPKGVTAEKQTLTKDSTEATFTLTVAADAPAGKFASITPYAQIMVNEEDVFHASGGAELKVFKPLPADLAAAAPPPPPQAENPEEKKPERKTRFPTT